MAVTEAAVVDEVRGHLGDPSEEQLPDSQIDRSIKTALRELSRYRPLQVEYPLTFFAGVSDYAIPPGVCEVLDSADQTSMAFDVDPVFGKYVEQAVPRWPAFIDRLDRATRAKLLVHPRQIQLLPGDMMRVSPTPFDTRPAVVLFGMTRSITDVTPEVYDAFVRYVMGRCAIFMGHTRNTRVRQVPTGVGMLRFDNGENWYAQGAALCKAAVAAWGGETTQVGAG